MSAIRFIRKPRVEQDPDTGQTIHSFTVAAPVGMWLMETGEHVAGFLSHGSDWNGRQDLSGWFASEKLNGCRACWFAGEFWTRQGLIIAAPDWFKRGLDENTPLDGEIVFGKGRSPAEFEKARLAVQCSRFCRGIQFRPFDIPQTHLTFEQAQAAIRATKFPAHVRPVRFHRLKDNADLLARFNGVIRAGGEGLMARKPGTLYAPGRTRNLLKVKP